MKKNHFFISYVGNKKNEADDIINKINFDNAENIIETFCGSSAISYHIWKKYGNKFNYYLNDNSKTIISFYELFKVEELETIEKELQKIGNTINNKDDWNNYYKTGKKSVYKDLFFFKYSSFLRVGLFHQSRDFKKLKLDLNNEQREFINFIKSPNVFISCDDWFPIFENHKNNEKSIIIFDPPYINTVNDFYIDKTLNVYQYFYDNKIDIFKSKIYLILEDIWIIRLLFANNFILISYNKQYGISKKKTNHLLIGNTTI